MILWIKHLLGVCPCKRYERAFRGAVEGLVRGIQMTSDEVPAELKEILDRRAGKVHSQNGAVMQTLAEILTRYEEMLNE